MYTMLKYNKIKLQMSYWLSVPWSAIKFCIKLELLTAAVINKHSALEALVGTQIVGSALPHFLIENGFQNYIPSEKISRETKLQSSSPVRCNYGFEDGYFKDLRGWIIFSHKLEDSWPSHQTHRNNRLLSGHLSYS